MPVHHEKTDRPRRSEVDTNDTRNPSLHRTKQREVSLERRPIISQDKPAAVKKTLKPDSQKTPRNAEKVIKIPQQKTGRNIEKPTASKSRDIIRKVPTKSTVVRQKSEEVEKIKSKVPFNVNPVTKHTVEVQKSKKLTSELPKKLSKTVAKSSKDLIKVPSKSRRSNHERTRTRTLSPSEVSVLKETSGSNLGSEKEKNGRLLDEEVNVEAQQEKEEETGEEVEEEDTGVEVEEEEEDYDDDFEDYESDFENDSEETSEPEPQETPTATEFEPATSAKRRVILTSAMGRKPSHGRTEDKKTDERKLDSGSDHTSAVAHTRIREIEDIRTAMQNENRMPVTEQLYEEIPDNTAKSDNLSIQNHAFDFTKAEKQHKKLENQNKVRRRGDILTQMITLDAITYTLLEIPAVPYDVFMSTYGTSNTTQVSVQTNEDDCEIDVQTEDIETACKWTQIPVKFPTKEDGSFCLPTKQERIGVGGHETNTPSHEEVIFSRTNSISLAKFLKKSSKKILNSIEARQQFSDHNVTMEPSELSCCDKMTKLQNSDRENSQVIFTAASSTSILTVNIVQKPVGNTVIYVWSLSDPTSPQYSLRCRSKVTTACFGPGKGHLVFAGSSDGSINIWDLRESSNMHFSSDSNQPLFRSPTYSTAQVLKSLSHTTPVVSVVVINKGDQHGLQISTTIQICSLAENGEVVIWTVIQLSQGRDLIINEDLGLAPWGRIKLVHSSTFNAANFLRDTPSSQFTALTTTKTATEILIAESSGIIIHCSTEGILLKPKYYMPSKTMRTSAVMSFSMYPADPRFFLAGCGDGTIRLYNVEKETPLISLHWNMADKSYSSIKSVYWIPSKPCMFFTLDAKSRVHIWNLAESDIYPQTSLPPSITPFICVALTKHGSFDVIVLGRSSGELELHYLKKEEDKGRRKEIYKRESKMFQKYVKIL